MGELPRILNTDVASQSKITEDIVAFLLEVILLNRHRQHQLVLIGKNYVCLIEFGCTYPFRKKNGG